MARMTDDQWQQALDWWDRKCAYCGKHPDYWNPLTGDHYIPKSSGGITTLDNMIPACKRCNRRKRNLSAREWIHEEFTPREARKLFRKLSAYFEWVEELLDEEAIA